MSFKKHIKNQLYNLQNNPLSKKIFQFEINKRSKLPFTQAYQLSKHINMFSPFTTELHKPNDWYGHAKIFKKFLNLPENYCFKFIIEHGTYLNDEVANIDLETNLPTFITYSKNRVKTLKRYRDFVFSIGPFINYADDLLSEDDLAKERKRLGKSLLLFPSHSTLDAKINFNINNLCKTIKKIGKDFNTIRVCLYWIDILKGHYKIYRDFGFEVVTAGHILDPNFIPRLKSIINLSTYTISNGISTHIAYCLSLNKPHFLIPQNLNLSGNKKEIRANSILKKTRAYNQIFEAFSKLRTKISPKQYSIANYYWGLDQVKTKKEFQEIINKSEKIYNNYNQ